MTCSAHAPNFTPLLKTIVLPCLTNVWPVPSSDVNQTEILWGCICVQAPLKKHTIGIVFVSTSGKFRYCTPLWWKHQESIQQRRVWERAGPSNAFVHSVWSTWRNRWAVCRQQFLRPAPFRSPTFMRPQAMDQGFLWGIYSSVGIRDMVFVQSIGWYQWHPKI